MPPGAEKIVEYAFKEWSVVSHAPVAFVAFMVVAVFLTWWGSSVLYRQQLASCHERIKTLETKLQRGSKLAAKEFLSPSQAQSLVCALRAIPPIPLAIFPFAAYPSTAGQADVLTSAFLAAGWHPGSGNAESQPFVTETQGKYGKGVWVVGPDREAVASALLDSGITNVRTHPNNDPGITCIVVGR
ncbi:MAG TPA: hypothetical protein VGS20_06040 [Candidatus Acidoferrales bacterium]|nr:hypothetical protein [Candidatus Acidoferrales bacterium]